MKLMDGVIKKSMSIEPQYTGIFCSKCHAPAHWTQIDKYKYIMDKFCFKCKAEMPKIEKIKLLTKN